MLLNNLQGLAADGSGRTQDGDMFLRGVDVLECWCVDVSGFLIAYFFSNFCHLSEGVGLISIPDPTIVTMTKPRRWHRINLSWDIYRWFFKSFLRIFSAASVITVPGPKIRDVPAV